MASELEMGVTGDADSDMKPAAEVVISDKRCDRVEEVPGGSNSSACFSDISRGGRDRSEGVPGGSVRSACFVDTWRGGRDCTEG